MRPSVLRHVLNNFDFEHFLHLRLKTVWESKNHKLVLWVKKVDFPQNNNKIIFEWQNIEAQLSWAKKYQKKHAFFQKWKFPSNSKQGTGSQRPICFPKTQILLRKTISKFLRLKRSLLRKYVKAKSLFFKKHIFRKIKKMHKTILRRTVGTFANFCEPSYCKPETQKYYKIDLPVYCDV